MTDADDIPWPDLPMRSESMSVKPISWKMLALVVAAAVIPVAGVGIWFLLEWSY